ncbi:uncharacterized protein (TIGR02117 family) [Luteibacter sp. Sphag1AF]|uniref:TIGR02117 family protein n=1 Tax=Luteibacter sp. Sphag1AF TaxID=2587031 RepID=UPI00160CF4DE|nr:TIGR02117 family protein [Luteibacter sp. Sphag1AF]MBB3227611.1 uncharacterized protein (TIGR02117 family) [Luteibacter sp. Sphag1AF]
MTRPDQGNIPGRLRRRTSRIGAFLTKLLLLLIALPVIYLLGALILGVVPVHPAWRDAPEGVTVWLTTNGVHAGLTMPSRNDVADWTVLYPPRPGVANDTVTVGWGDRTFFLNVPTWADLKASTAIYALSGLDGSVMHVEYDTAPLSGPDAIALTLTPEAYAALVSFIRQSTALDVNGRAIPVTGRSYASNDTFYEAHGRYSLFRTCNQWTRDALAAAGVRAPAWSPFDKALFWQLRGGHSGDNGAPALPSSPP